MVRGVSFADTVWDILYFLVMTSVFTLINAPPPSLAAKAPGEFRFIAGSCLGALLLNGIFQRAMVTPGILEYFRSIIDSIISTYKSTGSNVVQNALLDSLTADLIIDLMKSVILRGGGLVSCALLFFMSRQFSLFLLKLSQRGRGGHTFRARSFITFHVSPVIIWVLSVSLLFIVLTRIIKLEIPEILLWNILVLCIILYLAQGLGILQFFLGLPSVPSFLKLLLIVLFIIMIFSPVINAVLLAGIVLLGIAENWAPFRAPKKNGPPSTPEEGNGSG